MSLVSVEGLQKSYGDVHAVQGISFAVTEGEIFGLVGPNGAGKTTTLEIMEGLKAADSGTVTIAGVDVLRHPEKVKQLIGVQLQATAMFEKLTVAETLDLFRSFYDKSLPTADLLGFVSLEEKAGALTAELSGGQRQRLSIAMALVNDPTVVFLDEPTTGLDPQARRNLWDVVLSLRQRGKTIILTTHYMEEAERLCDRVAIVDGGKVIALDTVRGLIDGLGRQRAIEFQTRASATEEEYAAITGVERVILQRGAEEGEGAARQVILYCGDLQHSLSSLMEARAAKGWDVSGLQVRDATLEDVFLELTGRLLRE